MSSRKLSEHVEQELFDKEKRVTPSVSPEKKVKLSEGVEPVKKKKPYYRKKYNKPKPVEVVIPEPEAPNTFITGFSIGLIVGVILTSIIGTLIN